MCGNLYWKWLGYTFPTAAGIFFQKKNLKRKNDEVTKTGHEQISTTFPIQHQDHKSSSLLYPENSAGSATTTSGFEDRKCNVTRCWDSASPSGCEDSKSSQSDLRNSTSEDSNSDQTGSRSSDLRSSHCVDSKPYQTRSSIETQKSQPTASGIVAAVLDSKSNKSMSCHVGKAVSGPIGYFGVDVDDYVLVLNTDEEIMRWRRRSRSLLEIGRPRVGSNHCDFHIPT